MKRVCEQLWLMIAQTLSEFAQVASLFGGIQVLRHQRGGWVGWPNDDV